MTVSSETRTAGPFTGNGVTTDLPFSFRVFDDTDVIVVQTDPDGVESTLTLTTDYTVTLNADQGDTPGGTVVLNSPLVTGYLATLTSQVHNTQLAELTNVGGFYPAVINAALDKLTVLVQQAVNLTSRSVKIPLSDGTSGVTELPTKSIRAHKALVFDANGNIVASVDNYDDQAANAAASAAAAAASEAAATTQADIVITQASNAAASAAAAAATLNSALWRDVVFLTSADSPVTLNSASNGKLYRCDTSSGAVVFTLPQISSVTAPYNVSIKKETADGNAVTINRSGTDTIDGATSKTLTTAGGGTTLLADVDPAPDQWTAADFGQTAGNMTSDLFSGTGSQTAFTLSVSPGSAANTAVHIAGVRQRPTTDYTVSGTTLTFAVAPTAGTNNILAVSGTSLSIGTPADGTVSTTKLGGDITTAGKALLDDADAAAQLTTLGLYGTVIDRAYGELTTVRTGTTLIPFDDTLPTSSEGTALTGLTASITPKTATNRLRVIVSVPVATAAIQKAVVVALFVNGGANAIAVGVGECANNDNPSVINFAHEYIPGTTTAQTFTLRFGLSTASTITINGGAGARFFAGALKATIVVEELRA